MPRSTISDMETPVAPALDDEPTGDGSPLWLGDMASLVEEHQGFVRTYVYRVADDGRKVPPGFGDTLFLERLAGAPDFEDIRDRFGGGNYELMVQGKNGRMLGKRRVAISGARRELSTPEQATPAPGVAAAAPQPTSEQLAATLAVTLAETMARVLEPIVAKLATPPAPPVDQLTMLRETLTLVRELAPPQSTSATDGAAAVELLLKGMKLGRESEAGGMGVGDAIVQIAPQALDTIGRVAATFAQSRAPRPVRPTPAAANDPPRTPDASHATVVEPTLTPDPAPTEADAIGRATWLVAHLETMRQSGADAEKVADVVEDLLTDSEIELLTGLDAAGALQRLGMLGEVPPGLGSPDGRTWLGAFLDRLRASEEDEPAE